MGMESKESLFSLKFVHASEMMALPSPITILLGSGKIFPGRTKAAFF